MDYILVVDISNGYAVIKPRPAGEEEKAARKIAEEEGMNWEDCTYTVVGRLNIDFN